MSHVTTLKALIAALAVRQCHAGHYLAGDAVHVLVSLITGALSRQDADRILDKLPYWIYSVGHIDHPTLHDALMEGRWSYMGVTHCLHSGEFVQTTPPQYSDVATTYCLYEKNNKSLLVVSSVDSAYYLTGLTPALNMVSEASVGPLASFRIESNEGRMGLRMNIPSAETMSLLLSRPKPMSFYKKPSLYIMLLEWNRQNAFGMSPDDQQVITPQTLQVLQAVEHIKDAFQPADPIPFAEVEARSHALMNSE